MAQLPQAAFAEFSQWLTWRQLSAACRSRCTSNQAVLPERCQKWSPLLYVCVIFKCRVLSLPPGAGALLFSCGGGGHFPTWEDPLYSGSLYLPEAPGKESRLFFKKNYFYREGKGRRKKEREGNINVWVPLTWPPLGTWLATQAHALTGNRTSNPLVHSPCWKQTLFKV